MAKFQQNTLLRYQRIKEIYLQYKTDDIPDSVILKKYIYPVFPISRGTLNTVLSTPIEKELAKINNEKHGTSRQL